MLSIRYNCHIKVYRNRKNSGRIAKVNTLTTNDVLCRHASRNTKLCLVRVRPGLKIASY